MSINNSRKGGPFLFMQQSPLQGFSDIVILYLGAQICILPVIVLLQDFLIKENVAGFIQL